MSIVSWDNGYTRMASYPLYGDSDYLRNDTLVHVKRISPTYRQNRESVYPLGVDDFERKCFRLLPSGRWRRQLLHMS